MGIKEKANRRRRQKQALEIEACSITLPLQTALEVVHHFAPGSLKPVSKPRRPLPQSQGWQKLAKKKRTKKREKERKKEARKKGAKTKVNSRKRKSKQHNPVPLLVLERQKFALREYTNPTEPKPSKA